MRVKGFLLLFFGLFCIHSSFAQSSGELTQSRILILLDESSSMIQKWPSGKEKYKAADELILRLMDSIYAINNQVEFSLRVFGHQYTVEQNNCFDTKNEVPFSKDNRTQMALRLDDIRPLGVTPISYALLQAAKFDLVDEDRNAYSIILITDGGESCGGDLCEVMKKLMKYKVYFKPYIVSLEDDATLKTTYACMGDFLQVTKDADMPHAVTTIVNAFRPAIKITKAEYKELQTLAANAPSALKVTLPVIKPTEDNVIKKESEVIPLPKPAKKIDTVARVIVKETPKPKPDTVATPKPTKIKTDEAPVKPKPETIAHLSPVTPIGLFTARPAAKTMQPVSVPAVQIAAAPEAESIAGINPVHLKLFNYLLPPVKPMSPVTELPLPAIEAPVAPEKINHLSLSALYTVNAATPRAVKMNAVDLLPLPAIQIPVTLTAEKIDHLFLYEPHSIAISAPRTTKLNAVELPPLPAIETPVTLTPEKIGHLSLSPLYTVSTSAPGITRLTTVPQPALPQIQAPVTITPESVSRMAMVQQHTISIAPPVAALLQQRQTPPLPALIIDTPATPKPLDKIARIPLRSARTSNIIFVFQDDQSLVPRKVPELPPLKIDLPKAPIAKVIPVKEDNLPFKKAEYTAITEDAKETTVEVYLTNGHGKFFTASPQMLLMEPATNKVIKTFYRTVDADGNPDPITTLPSGTYNIALSAKRSIGLSNVKIEANKKNKITVTVLPATLSFYYIDAPDRPVTEFMARVIERNKSQGRVQDQKCTSKMEYEAGDYHIMINTLPQIDRTTDLGFEETGIGIAQPGFVKFVFDPKLKSVVLYKQEGDKFLSFYTLNMADVATQPLRLQPGAYQVHYRKGPGGPAVSDKVLPFLVKATQTVTVDLN